MGKARFTKAEITRAVEAAKACGLVVAGVRVGPDGSIEITCPVDSKSETPQRREPKRYNAG